MSSIVTVSKFIVCEGLRVELGGKHILLGVYFNDVIVVQRFPATVGFSLWVVFEPHRIGRFEGRLRLANRATGIPLLTMPLNLTVNTLTAWADLLTVPPFVVQERTDLPCEIGVDREPWEAIGNVGITTAELQSLTGSPVAGVAAG